MRSISMLAVVTGTLVLASACGDGGGTPPPDNVAPVAGFAEVCTQLSCVFTDASTDPDGNETITARSWNFGDNTPAGTGTSPTHVYAAAGPYAVVLTVTDDEAETDDFTKIVTVTGAPPVNTPPTAGFTSSCTNADCTFTNTSTDVAPGTIQTYAWTFGDGATSDVRDPTHSYTVTAPTDFTVTLTVTDNEGATDLETQTVTPAPNTPPTAGFTHSCNATDCTFTSTSTDVAPGSIATYAWTFGDNGTANVDNPTHRYVVTAPRDFTVTLTVTDNDGASDVETQTITVSPAPPGAEGCTTAGPRVDCLLNITARSTVKLKLLDINCDLPFQRITVPQPIGDQVFLNVCSRTVGDSTRIFGGPQDRAIVFEPGSQVRIRFIQGTAGGGDPALVPPAGHLVGTFPNWTISFEDGAHSGDAGEPDFIDVVLGVEAVAAP